MKFGVPQLFSKLTLPKLERELEGVLNLILFRPLRPQIAMAHSAQQLSETIVTQILNKNDFIH